MTRRALAAATGLILRSPAWVISAFQSATAAPLAQVAASTGSAVRKASRLAPENSVQAIVMSQAGLPTPEMFGFTRT